MEQKRSLEELLREMPTDLREKVRDYAQYLLTSKAAARPISPPSEAQRPIRFSSPFAKAIFSTLIVWGCICFFLQFVLQLQNWWFMLSMPFWFVAGSIEFADARRIVLSSGRPVRQTILVLFLLCAIQTVLFVGINFMYWVFPTLRHVLPWGGESPRWIEGLWFLSFWVLLTLSSLQLLRFLWQKHPTVEESHKITLVRR